MICDITNILEASHGPMFNLHKCYVETWSLQCTYTENGLNRETFGMKNKIGILIDDIFFPHILVLQILAYLDLSSVVYTNEQ